MPYLDILTQAQQKLGRAPRRQCDQHIVSRFTSSCENPTSTYPLIERNPQIVPISLLSIVINISEITSVAQITAAFFCLSDEGDTCKSLCYSNNVLSYWPVACVSFFDSYRSMFCRLRDCSSSDCQLVSAVASLRVWVSFRAPVIPLPKMVASTPQSLSSHTSH